MGTSRRSCQSLWCCGLCWKGGCCDCSGSSGCGWRLLRKQEAANTSARATASSRASRTSSCSRPVVVRTSSASASSTCRSTSKHWHSPRESAMGALIFFLEARKKKRVNEKGKKQDVCCQKRRQGLRCQGAGQVPVLHQERERCDHHRAGGASRHARADGHHGQQQQHADLHVPQQPGPVPAVGHGVPERQHPDQHRQRRRKGHVRRPQARDPQALHHPAAAPLPGGRADRGRVHQQQPQLLALELQDQLHRGPADPAVRGRLLHRGPDGAGLPGVPHPPAAARLVPVWRGARQQGSPGRGRARHAHLDDAQEPAGHLLRPAHQRRVPGTPTTPPRARS